ncbi:Trk system potassium transport protein TrkA [Solemya velum gill symbiont]|uniref:Trk system potassium transporter TrkA n=1 Tax=Solemya velum gill symbiont TaxID=2340 RepID=UPI000998001D|nr:Trk system potassium transporter TrkA [Solemya velum gill symbiont]OOZ81092.1 Trk system potassium transport protein TrkA [Solemya velum gill symbiont]
MKIVILGAGQVGKSVAATLASEHNDITVVDQDTKRLESLQGRYDLRTVHGYASYPDILAQSGIEDADMLIAVTQSDEINMTACQIAWNQFRTPRKIARVRAPEYLANPELFGSDAIPIDVLISPEQQVTDSIISLIQNPGALQVVDFAKGRARMVGVKAYHGGPLVGHELRELNEHLPGVHEARVAAIYRDDRSFSPNGSTVIEADDELFFIAASENIKAVVGELRRTEKAVRRLIIAGGGNIGRRLAIALQKDYNVKLIERDQNRARMVAEELTDTIVLSGDISDEELLLEENIENTDAFVAVTNDEEANVLSSMLAKQLGARKVMALINRASYVDLVQSGPIDIAISPQQATIGSLLTYIRRGDVAVVHALRHGAAEAIEAVAHGDKNSSKVVGRQVDEIKLPEGANIGAIVRGDDVLMAHHDTVIEPNDHVIIFLMDKGQVKEVERLFQVGIGFI